MVNSNHDPLHTVVRFCNGDDDCVETMVIDEGLGWIQVKRKNGDFGEFVKMNAKLVLILLESVYICVVKI